MTLENTTESNSYLKQIIDEQITLRAIPEEDRTYEICLVTVSNYGYNLRSVPAVHKDYEMCLATVSNHGYALLDVPEVHKDYKLCLAAMRECKDTLDLLPNELFNRESGFNNTLGYVPEELRESILLELNN
jgi:hypothetical protein